MLIVTTANIAGKEIDETLGLVKGSSVRAKHIGKDISASLKGLVGGEIESYHQLQDDSRKMAIARMEEDAIKMGADAIVMMRITSSSIAQGVSEILCYGTAVKLK